MGTFLCKSSLKLRKILRICFKSFVNSHPGGVEPQLRKVVWKHILGVYPAQLNGRERMDYMRQKSSEYEALKETWINLAAQGQVPDKVKLVTNMIRKDVLRTDRHHKFFASKKFISIFQVQYCISLPNSITLNLELVQSFKYNMISIIL